jgi:hypothetical protein
MASLPCGEHAVAGCDWRSWAIVRLFLYSSNGCSISCLQVFKGEVPWRSSAAGISCGEKYSVVRTARGANRHSQS